MRPSLKIFLAIFCLFYWMNEANAKNKYTEIAAKYDVEPFNLEFGYPLSYKWDERDITGVIYLTDDFEFFEELSPRVYLAQPNAEDAELIATYYADDVEFPKYYLVVGNTVQMVDLIVFMDRLMKDELEMEVCFVGGNGKFVSVKYDNWSRLTDPGTFVCGIYQRNVIEIMMNSRNDLLIESNFPEMDTISTLVKYYYSVNLYGNDRDYNQFNYDYWDREKVLRKARQIEAEIEKYPDYKIFKFELEKIIKKRRLTDRFKTVLEPSGGFYISLKKQRGTSLKAWYELLNQVQHGVHLARSAYFKKRFNGNYLELFYSHDPIYLDLLEFTFPDRMMEKEEYWGSPPEIIEIIEKAPEPPVLDPGCQGSLAEQYEPSIPPMHIDIDEPDEELEFLLDSL